MNILDGLENSRRDFLRAGVSLAGVTLLGTETIMAQTQSGGAGKPQPSPKEKGEKREGHDEHDEEVSPGEDLMREHGVLKRILLVYEESERRLLAGAAEVSPDAIHKSGP